MWNVKVLLIPLMLLVFLHPVNSPAAASDMEVKKDKEKINIKDILKSADRSRGNLEGLAWSVETRTAEKDKNEQVLKFRLLTKNSNSLVKFTSPSRMGGQMMLMRDRNMWFIRPGLRKPVAISPRQRLTGAASNGDIASTNYAEDYDATLVGEEVLDGVPCYVLDLVANSKDVTYDKIKYWVSKSDGLGKHAGFYTVSGKLFKEASFEYKNQIIKNKTRIPFVSEMVITDTNSGTVTILTYRDITIQDIPNSTFNLNLLVR